MLIHASIVWAGPVIIDGTDSNDHGFCISSNNQNGWFYMQRALEHLADVLDASVTKVVVNLGATDSGATGCLGDGDSKDAYDAIHSAFDLSTLPGNGWILTDVDGASNITTWLAALSTSNTGILAIPSAGLTTGDLTSAEQTSVNNKATQISNFVAGNGTPTFGGAVFALGEIDQGSATGYRWVTTLIPNLCVRACTAAGSNTDLNLTSDGTAAFPGLTNDELSTGPWHNYFGTGTVKSSSPTCVDKTPSCVADDLGGLTPLFRQFASTASSANKCPDSSATDANACIVGIGGGAGTTFEVQQDEGWGWTHRP